MNMTDDHKAAMLAGRKALKTVSKQNSDCVANEFQAQVLKRVSEYLPSAKLTFQKAFSGKSKALAIKAKCIECSNLQKQEVALCQVLGCPLYPYRPYRGAK